MIIWVFAIFIRLASASVVNASASATPLGKVVELIDILKEHLDEDTLKDGNTYADFAELNVKETDQGKRKIRETKTKIDELQTDLDQEDADRAQMKRDFEAAATELTKAEKELADAKNERDKEHKIFVKNDEVFEESLDQLSRSLEVLAKRFQDQKEGGASLLSFATNLKHTLEHSKDIALTTVQKETLRAFYRAAQRKASEHVSFLQVRSLRHSDPDEDEAEGSSDYGEYESQSSPVIETLKKVETKTQENKEAAMQEEEAAATQFSTISQQLNEQINTAKTRMDELKTQIAESEQRSSELTADLLASKELLEATKKHVELLEQDFRTKTRSYKQRALKRSDELTAVKEAIQVLTSETAKRYMSQQSIGIMESPEGANAEGEKAAEAEGSNGAQDFLQVKQETRKKALHLVQTVGNSGLILLTLQTQTHSADREDPFGKVKTMIKQMLDKLVDDSNKDADHHAFCEAEMTKSTESFDSKSADVQKLTDQLAFMSAELERLTDELAEAKQDSSDMAQALSSAAKLREQEKLRATQAIKDYSDAQALLKRGIDILKKFYSKEAIEADTADTLGSDEVHGEKNREGLGHGVLAILEIAYQDFSELEEETRLEETKAEQMFKDLSQETSIRNAQFQKDIEYKMREKVKLEGEQARAQADLKSYQKELSAVEDYLKELRGQCIAKVDPYEVRKARREKELQGLNEALQYLTG